MRKVILIGLIGLLLPLPASAKAPKAVTANRIQNSTFASLPKAPVAGEIYNVTDATVCTGGVPLTVGGGTMLCQVTYNGTGWIPAGGASGPLISGVMGCLLPANVVAGHDNDTPICVVDYGASGTSSLPPGNYVVTMTGNVGVTFGPTPPTTLGFDVIDASGRAPLWILQTSWEPDALLVANTTVAVAVSTSSNFTITEAQAKAGPTIPSPSMQAFPVAQDVTILKDSSMQFQITGRTTTPGYDAVVRP
jgi:hypothetical protein